MLETGSLQSFMLCIAHHSQLYVFLSQIKTSRLKTHKQKSQLPPVADAARGSLCSLLCVGDISASTQWGRQSNSWAFIGWPQ